MQALDIAETLIKSGTVDVVVIDSVAALVPKAELEGDMGDHHIALQVRSSGMLFSKERVSRWILIYELSLQQYRIRGYIIFRSMDRLIMYGSHATSVPAYRGPYLLFRLVPKGASNLSRNGSPTE